MILRLLLDLITGQKRCAYIQVRRNSITVKDVYSSRTETSPPDLVFTTRRLLVGDFVPASKCLEAMVKRLYGNPVLPIRVPTVVHQLEMVEDGLSAVEERVLYELADTASCNVAQIHIGRELSNAEVIEIVRSKRTARGA